MRPEDGLRPLEILLVEDNPADARLALEAFRECRRAHHLRVVEDGAAALAYLRHEGEYAAAPRPDLVLLDLNLPRIDGHTVLREIKSDPRLCTIPVVVLTTSTSEQDVRAAYEAHANGYVAKPVDFERFGEIVASIESFWMNAATLPPH